MSYNSKLPMDDEYIAAGPADIRENLRALKEDQIVDAGTLAGLPVGNASGNIPEANGIVNKNLNADLLDGHEASDFATVSHNHSSSTASTAGFMSAADKTKLDSIATGAQVNQNAFGNVVVGTTTMQADSVTDTLTLTAGTNISLTPDATNDVVTIAVTGMVASAITANTCTGNAATATNATNHIATTSDAHTASAIEVTAIGNISSTDVQSALAELDAEKVNVMDVATAATANKLLKLNSSGILPTGVTGSSTSCTGNSATATCAATLGKSGAASNGMIFNWSGQGGQPTWLWGGSDGTNMYVYNPSNFNVNSIGGYSAAQLITSSNISILTGSLGNDGTIPLPNGYAESQCHWTIALANIYQGSGGSSACSLSNRTVVFGGNVTPISVNYIIVGVK